MKGCEFEPRSWQAAEGLLSKALNSQLLNCMTSAVCAECYTYNFNVNASPSDGGVAFKCQS